MIRCTRGPGETPRAGKPEFLTDNPVRVFQPAARGALGLADAGFEYCTPIQAEALPVLLQGRDVAGQAHTGTGKTAAFLVTVISRPAGHAGPQDRPAPGPHHGPHPRAVPADLRRGPGPQPAHGHHPARGGRAASTTGSRPRAFEKGTDIVIGTPGRIIDYYKQGILKTKDIKFLVIDEADRLLDLGFEKDMRYILRKLPHLREAPVHALLGDPVLPRPGADLRVHEPARVHLGDPGQGHGRGDRADALPRGHRPEVPAPAGAAAARGLQRACSSSST
ncbi:MAG: DEAD/DEAH box helicase [Desulfobacterales bacterium]|nr:DEAD/DEAH box helicase [Desulfobacterales bacterium]